MPAAVAALLSHLLLLTPLAFPGVRGLPLGQERLQADDEAVVDVGGPVGPPRGGDE